MVTNGFGPELGGGIIYDKRAELSNDPEDENQWMSDGFPANIHPLDDDIGHMQSHFQDMQATGDPHGLKRPHMMMHQQQQAQKIQAQMAQQMQMQAQGAGQGPGRPPGAQQPQPGAMPAGPRLIKGHSGSVHPDQMTAAGGITMPRNM
jgi:hypothetical protein